jgi:hypothetical protein
LCIVIIAVSVTQKFADLECTQQLTSVQNDLSCRNIVGRAGSAKGMCNSDDSKLPLPAGNFTTVVYVPFTPSNHVLFSWLTGYCLCFQ